MGKNVAIEALKYNIDQLWREIRYLEDDISKKNDVIMQMRGDYSEAKTQAEMYRNLYSEYKAKNEALTKENQELSVSLGMCEVRLAGPPKEEDQARGREIVQEWARMEGTA